LGSGGIAPVFDLGTRWRWVVSVLQRAETCGSESRKSSFKTRWWRFKSYHVVLW